MIFIWSFIFYLSFSKYLSYNFIELRFLWMLSYLFYFKLISVVHFVVIFEIIQNSNICVMNYNLYSFFVLYTHNLVVYTTSLFQMLLMVIYMNGCGCAPWYADTQHVNNYYAVILICVHNSELDNNIWFCAPSTWKR